MNENINLCEILKGHEGETFYSVKFGDVILYGVYGNTLAIMVLKYNSICVEANVADIVTDLFPSKNQRDWNKWVEEQKSKPPKTWLELCKDAKVEQYEIITDVIFDDNDKMIDKSSAVGHDKKLSKSALALLKIHQLIEYGYGGNVKARDRVNFYTIQWSYEANRFVIRGFGPYLEDCGTLLCFHTKEQAIEFLSKPENVQLLKDYFMI